MTWHPSHPGGVITCDHPGCTRERRNYCTPTERDQWQAVHVGGPLDGHTRDYCPEHKEPKP